MTMKKYIYLFVFLVSLSLYSCENFLEPLTDTRVTEEQLMKDPAWLEGLLLKAYSGLPNNYSSFNLDVASDDAVTNQQSSSITTMATGGWKSSVDPISVWEDDYEMIRHLNLFLTKVDDMVWSFTPRLSDSDNLKKDKYTKIRLKGEAYGMRAYYMSQLLQFHSGKAADGTLLGFPIITSVLTFEDDLELPRNTFADCVKQIFSDLDSAIILLPAVYADSAGTAASMYNAASGAKFEGRMNGNAAKALKARVALLAASPAYSESGAVTWAQAATYAGDLLKNLGALYPAGKTYYTETKNKEMIWNQAYASSRGAESNNFPPSLFGLGRTNPTQSLVDAFPMKNGYPTGHELSLFDSANPYNLRDSRLGDYIIYNGANYKSKVINTYVGADLDGLGTLETSTRTGYYLKKFMLPAVSLTTGQQVSTNHTYALFRMTEVLLNYAEAANEAWGATGDPNGYGFTAKSKIGDLRARAGITAPDPYLQGISSDADLRELIHNERRIELCFEGFRFWDIRRWENGAVNITKPATGVQIINNTGVLTYSYPEVEPRIYQPFMIYGPIPYNETLKYNIIQNAGW